MSRRALSDRERALLIAQTQLAAAGDAFCRHTGPLPEPVARAADEMLDRVVAAGNAAVRFMRRLEAETDRFTATARRCANCARHGATTPTARGRGDLCEACAAWPRRHGGAARPRGVVRRRAGLTG